MDSLISCDSGSGRSKAQSAVEYITTYSWALLVLAIVIAALFELGLFNPNQFTQQECTITADFSCVTYFLAQNGLLTINLQQTTQNPINVTGIECTQNTTSYKTSPGIGSANQITMQIQGNYTFLTFCTYSNYTPVFVQAGNVYSGNIQVNFTDLDTGFSHTDIGKIVVKAS